MNVLPALQKQIREACSVDVLKGVAELLDDMPVPGRLEKLIRVIEPRLSATERRSMYADALAALKKDQSTWSEFISRVPDDDTNLNFLAQTMQTAKTLTSVFGDDSDVFEDLFECVMERATKVELPGLTYLAKLENDEDYRYLGFLSVADDILNDVADGSVPNLETLRSTMKALSRKYQKAIDRAKADRQPDSETDIETSDEEKTALKAEVKQLREEAADLRRQLATAQSAKPTPVVASLAPKPTAKPALVSLVSKPTDKPASVVVSLVSKPTAASVLSAPVVSKPDKAAAEEATDPKKLDSDSPANLSFGIIKKALTASKKGLKRSIEEFDASAVGGSKDDADKQPPKKPRKTSEKAKKSDEKKKEEGKKPRVSKPRAGPKAAVGISPAQAKKMMEDMKQKMMEDIRKKMMEELVSGHASSSSSGGGEKKKKAAKAPSPDTLDYL